MTPELSTREVGHLPRLSWIARIERGVGRVHVVHGSSVEVGGDYVVEGVWDAPFAGAGFHRAEHFFGSGLRIEEGRVWIVPSHALVDRVVYCERGGDLLVSNSLALLLGYAGARLDAGHDYREQTRTLLKGLDGYDPRFPVVHPQIDHLVQVYHDPVLVMAERVIRVPDRGAVPLASFDEYIGRIEEALERIRDNLTSQDRRFPMRMFTTTSSGYDSTAVTALVRKLGVEASFTARRSRRNILPLIHPNILIDDGTPITRRLGVPTRYFEPPRHGVSSDEIFFYAPCTDGAQVLFHTMAREIEQSCRAAVVFTGFHGDKVWDLHTGGEYLSDQMRRGDVSGLDLSEIRLKAGFVDAAIPFMFARNIRDLIAIAASPEMAPWRLGSDYDRPIPRRIVETAGVPRGVFGREKRAALERPPFPFHPDLRREFIEFVRARHGSSPVSMYRHRRIWRAINQLRKRLGLRPSRVAAGPVAPASGQPPIDLSYELHLWALETLSRRLGAPFHTTGRRADPLATPQPS